MKLPRILNFIGFRLLSCPLLLPILSPKSFAYEILAQPQVSESAAAKGIIHLLTSQPHQMIGDTQGHRFEVFFVERDPKLQGLIDDLTSRILHTSVGRRVCAHLLNADPALIVRHLGVSQAAAYNISRECSFAFRRPSSSIMVANSRADQPSKSSLSQNPRTYTIIITNQAGLPVDSWTDSLTNRTSLFLSRSTRGSGSDLNWQHLLQILAHEMAIYFDAKSWPWGPEWSLLPRGLADVMVAGAEATERVQLATLNPLINTSMAFIRAYKVERLILREIFESGKLGPEVPYYNQQNYPFLSLSCGTTCLGRFIRSQVEWLKPLGPALLGYFPHYRSRQLLWSAQHPSGSTVSPENLKLGLETIPEQYMSSLFNSPNTMLNLVTTLFTPIEESSFDKVTDVLVKSLMPQDLAILEQSHVQVGQQAKLSDLLPFLAEPTLSDANTMLSAGPRPRIRTGGTE